MPGSSGGFTQRSDEYRVNLNPGRRAFRSLPQVVGRYAEPMSFQPQPQHDLQTASDGHGRHEGGTRLPQSRSESADAGGGLSKLLMAALIALALVASLLMLFLDSDLWLKIAVIAALWAAFLGAVLVNRYSSALSAERQRIDQMERSHDSELRREQSEHRQREAELESSYAQQMREQRDAHLEQLRHELAVMRQQLSSMTGRDYETEQASVHARSERVRELSNGSPSTASEAPRAWQQQQSQPAAARSARSTPSQPAAAQSAAKPAPAQSTNAQPANNGFAANKLNGQGGERVASKTPNAHRKPTPAFSTGSFAAVRWDGQDTKETTQLPLVVDATAMDEEPQRTRKPEAPVAAAPKHDKPATGGRRRKPDVEPQEESHAGRRRADESGGLTVAELMAKFKKD